MITKEIYDRLTVFEQHLGNAYKGNYVRALTTKDSSTLAEIFEEIFNQKSRIRNGCGHCVLSDMKLMGKEYFQYKEQLEKIEIPEIEQVETETEPVNVTSSESEDKPKRKGRKVTNKDNKN